MVAVVVVGVVAVVVVGVVAVVVVGVVAVVVVGVVAVVVVGVVAVVVVGVVAVVVVGVTVVVVVVVEVAGACADEIGTGNEVVSVISGNGCFESTREAKKGEMTNARATITMIMGTESFIVRRYTINKTENFFLLLVW